MTRSPGIELKRLRELYDRRYFLGDCEGHERFARNQGQHPSRRLKKCIGLLDPAPGETIIDVGCGRGEIALHAAASGAFVTGLDISVDALQLANQARLNWVIPPSNLNFVQARAESMPISTSSADAVMMSDVIEHIRRADVPTVLQQCHRVLKPGGRLVVHTQPNRRLLNTTVPLLSHCSHLWGVSLPTDFRTEMTRGAGPDYHVNEQTRGQMASSLRRAGFHIEQLWLEGTYPIHRIFGDSRLKPWLIRRFRRSRLMREFLASQIFAVARR